VFPDKNRGERKPAPEAHIRRKQGSAPCKGLDDGKLAKLENCEQALQYLVQEVENASEGDTESPVDVAAGRAECTLVAGLEIFDREPNVCITDPAGPVDYRILLRYHNNVPHVYLTFQHLKW
jgi:hypothetical protein